VSSSQVYQQILTAIHSGRYSPGERLPSERDISREHSCTLWAAHTAMDTLRKQGFVVSRGRNGSFVRENLSFNDLKRRCNAQSRDVHVVVSKMSTTRGTLPLTRIIDDLERRMDEAGLTVTYGEYPTGVRKLQAFLEDRLEREARAIILVPDYAQWEQLWSCAHVLDRLKGNLICLNRGLGDTADLACHFLSADPAYEARLATAHLLDNGIRHIGFVGEASSMKPWWLNQRLRGIHHILGINRLDPDIPQWVAPDLKGARSFISSGSQPTAIISANDKTAAALIDYLDPLGVVAGEHYSLVSFDNDPSYRTYGLTTVDSGTSNAGGHLADLITSGDLGSGHRMHRQLLLRGRLVERGTVVGRMRRGNDRN